MNGRRGGLLLGTDELEQALEPFFDGGWIAEVLHEVKSGKEATVFCCRADPARGRELIAAKVYRARRLFRNDTVYQEGRINGNARTRRAIAGKSSYGRGAHDDLWAATEFETLRRLHAAGADVPEPLTGTGDAFLMEFIGDADEPATPLYAARLTPQEAPALFARLIADVELWLRHDIVHADLSPFNILYRPGRLTVIDFPQAVDPRFNGQASALLARDLGHVCNYFRRLGINADADDLAAGMWARHLGTGFIGGRPPPDVDDEEDDDDEEKSDAPILVPTWLVPPAVRKRGRRRRR